MSFIKEYANEQEYLAAGMGAFGVAYKVGAYRTWAIDRERNLFVVKSDFDRFKPSIDTFIYFYRGFFLEVNLLISGSGDRGSEGITRYEFYGFFVNGDEEVFSSQMTNNKEVWDPFKEAVTLLTIDLECFTKHLIEFDF
jgi:hypothetical protein